MFKKFITIIIICVCFSASAFADNYADWSRKPYDKLDVMAYGFLQKKYIDSALVCYTIIEKGYDECRQSDKKGIERCIFAMNNIGYIYFFYYFDYEKSYHYLLKALQLSQQYHLQDVKAHVYLNLANLYRTNAMMHDTHEYDHIALDYYRKAFYCALGEKDWRAFIVMYYGLANFAMSTGNTEVIAKETAVFRRQPIPKGISLLRFSKFFSYCTDAYSRHDYARSLNCLDSMLVNIDAQDTPERFRIFTLLQKSDVLSLTGKKSEAECCLKEAEAMAERYNSRDLQVYVSRSLYLFHLTNGDIRLANRYKLDYLEKKDSLVNGGKMESMAKMRFMEQLRQVNETVEQMSRQRQRQNLTLAIVIIIAFIIAAFSLLLIRSYRKLQRSHRVLYRQNIEMQQREDEQRLKYSEKYRGSKLADEDKAQITERIQNVMENTDEICSEDFSLARLTTLADSNYKHVSQVINEVYKKNFNTLLNEYRIKEVCRRLNDFSNYGNLTIEAVGMSVGFRSRSNFESTFKQNIGMSPSEYRKIAKESASEQM
jgi:AraC-like DNA-binding protein